MIGIGINETGDWFAIKGLVISVERMFYVASIIATYYIAKREQIIRKKFKNCKKKIQDSLDEK